MSGEACLIKCPPGGSRSELLGKTWGQSRAEVSPTSQVSFVFLKRLQTPANTENKRVVARGGVGDGQKGCRGREVRACSDGGSPREERHSPGNTVGRMGGVLVPTSILSIRSRESCLHALPS